MLNDFEADGVVYLELRTTPRALPTASPPISKVDYVDTILSVITDKNRNSSLHTNLILSIDRRSSLDDALVTVDIAIARRSRGIVGIDLCGDPSKGDISSLRPAFIKARASGLKICVHFGEIPGANTLELEEMLSWQPDRIGHAIYLPETIKREVRRRGLGVEMCLSCNVHAKMLPGEGSFEEHHFREWWKERGNDSAAVALCVSADLVHVMCLSTPYVVMSKPSNTWRNLSDLSADANARRMMWAFSAVPCPKNTFSQQSIFSSTRWTLEICVKML